MRYAPATSTLAYARGDPSVERARTRNWTSSPLRSAHPAGSLIREGPDHRHSGMSFRRGTASGRRGMAQLVSRRAQAQTLEPAGPLVGQAHFGAGGTELALRNGTYVIPKPDASSPTLARARTLYLRYSYRTVQAVAGAPQRL